MKYVGKITFSLLPFLYQKNMKILGIFTLKKQQYKQIGKLKKYSTL